MNNYKKTPNRKNRVKSVDGFINTSGTLNGGEDLKKRFRQSYRSTQANDFEVSQDLNEISSPEDGFTSSNTEILASEPRDNSSFNLSLGDENVEKKHRRFLFFKKRQDRPKRSIKKRIARGFGFSFLALLLIGASLLGFAYLKQRQIFKGNGTGSPGLQKNVDPTLLNGEGDGRVNILLLGKGGPGHEAPDLTDTILLASIDPVQNEAALLSIPRDLYVKDDSGYSTKINAIYSNAKQKKLAELGKNSAHNRDISENAGLAAIKKAVSEVIGVPVHYYTMIDFTAFEDAINTVGGISIDVKEPLYDATMAWLNNGSSLLADKGLQKFDGKHALFYARSRHGSTRGDFDRTERQRQVIVALKTKILSLGTFSNPLKIVELLNTLGNNVRTDLNGINELKRLYEIGQSIDSAKITSVGLADPPNQLVTTAFIDSQSVVIPVEGLYEYDNIKFYIRNTLRDAFLKQEDAKIYILNGTKTAGLATKTEKELKSYGYNVVKIDNAPTDNYKTTKLVDLSGGMNRYTLSYLEKRLGVSVSNEVIAGLPSSTEADFVIILGSQ